MPLVFSLSILPASINRLYAMGAKGWLIPTPEGNRFIEYAKNLFIQQLRTNSYQQEVLSLSNTTPLRLTIEFHNPNWVTSQGTIANRSLDNLPRAVQDALSKALKSYNSQFTDTAIVELHLLKIKNTKTETVLILEKLGEA